MPPHFQGWDVGQDSQQRDGSDRQNSGERSSGKRTLNPLDLEGKRVGHYEKEASLNGGGMRIVYRAPGLELSGSMALKFLSSHLFRDPEVRECFERKSRTAATLDYHSIATVHDIEEPEVAGGSRRCIAIADYERGTLREKLSREGPLSFEEDLKYAVQIGVALRRAHEVGIVHRDVKPDNVMPLRRGEGKLLNFGLERTLPRSIL